jgi:hypothetical protein
MHTVSLDHMLCQSLLLGNERNIFPAHLFFFLLLK